MIAVVTAPDIPGHVKITDAPQPQAARGHAIVRVQAASINRGELRLIPARPNGWAPGQDVAGTIEHEAPDGGPAAGTRVVGLADGGGWSELVSVPVARLAPIPANVSFEAAAALPVAGLTGLRALRRLGDVLGRDVLVTGVTGGTGHFAAQLAVLAGATVTGLARRDAILEGVRIVAALDPNERFDRVIDAVGGDVLSEALRHLRPDAKVVFFGAVGGPATFDLGTFGASPRSTVEPLFVYEAAGDFADDLALLVASVSAGRLVPTIGGRFGFDRINDALDSFAHGVQGKIVLVRQPA